MRRTGFALLEVILVIAVLGTVTGLAVPLYRDYQIRNDLSLATEQVTQGLARARLLAQSGQDDAAWGFFIPSGTLYKGNSYASRDAASDEVYPMPSTITTTGLSEVYYSKLKGVPSSTGAITLTALNQDQRTIYIKVEMESVAVVENDNLTICHYPPGNPGNANTITITEASWPTHRDNHGDTMGACAGGGASSSSVSSSSSSASSTGAQSSSSAGGGSACADRFSVAADGTITTTGAVDVTYRVLGSAVTYGAGGPEVNVYVSRKNLTGNSYSDLFSGSDVDGGETQTVTNYTNGKQVVVKVRGYFRQSGWMTFDQTYRSNDQTGHIVILRNGAALPNYPAFNNQQSLQQFLRDVIVNNVISIGQYDLLILVELGSLTSSAADFQDAVILVSFSQPSC